MKKQILLLAALSFTILSHASVKSVCSEEDSRVQLPFEPIARVSKMGRHSGCTATLISKNCAITAGHCKDTLFKGEFLVPDSINDEGQTALAENTFPIDATSIQFNDGGRGNDWAVFKFENNEKTGFAPGEVFGFYEVENYEPKTNQDLLRISGYGIHWDNKELSYTLLSATGYADYIGYSSEGRSLLNHYVDTTPGSSGATVINISSGKIIGIHAQGGCGGSSIWNSATIIKGHKKLQDAIKACLASEK